MRTAKILRSRRVVQLDGLLAKVWIVRLHTNHLDSRSGIRIDRKGRGIVLRTG